MDTRWKKCKAAAGFLAFFLGITLLAGGLQGIVLGALDRNDPYCSLREMLAGDYKNTKYFREQVSVCLNDLIGMALADGADGAEAHEAQERHEAMKWDENLLYEVCLGGKILYANKMYLSRYAVTGISPQGYDFLLWFDGDRVRIFQDGKELEIYGDGYYEGGSQWDVPGYKNRAPKEETGEVDVYMAVRQIPEQYYDAAAPDGYERVVSPWYLLAQLPSRTEKVFYVYVACICIAVILLFVYVPLRKGKRRVDQAAAVLLGRVWVEGKLALALVLAVLLMVTSGGLLSALGRIWQSRVVLPLLIWAVYFAVLDCRNNRDMLDRGLCVRALRLYRSKQLQASFRKRLLYRCIPLAGSSLILCAVFLGLAFFSGRGYLVCAALSVTGVFLAVFFVYVYREQRVASELDLLAQRMAAVRDGDYSAGYTAEPDSALGEIAQVLEEIRQGTEKAVEEQIRSQRMKVELVTNMSHDIRTPLTSIVSYVQLLKKEEGLEEHVKDYVRILDEKTQRLKNMVQDVFEVSKAASGQLVVRMDVLDFGKLLRQTLADMDEQIRSSFVTIKTEIPEQAVLIRGDGEKLYRVFQNLIQNALKYSLEGSRVYIALSVDAAADTAQASVKNVSRAEIDPDRDYTERFVRGDESRTDGGSGLGLSIASSFTEACGGRLRQESTADLFVVTVTFPLARPQEEEG